MPLHNPAKGITFSSVTSELSRSNKGMQVPSSKNNLRLRVSDLWKPLLEPEI